MTIGATSSSIPFHLARAYGLERSAAGAPVAPLQGTRPVGRIAPAGGPEAAPAIAGVRTGGIDRLVGAVVPGKIDFSQAAPVPRRAEALPFYTRPGDLNAAAVNIHAGRAVDVEG